MAKTPTKAASERATLATGPSAVDEALTEIAATLAQMDPIHEGLRDYSRLNLTPEAMTDVLAAIATYDRRTALLTTAQAALTALATDGHPVLTLPPVSAAVLADLDTNQATVTAALAQFTTPPQATDLGLSASPPEPQRPPDVP